MPKEPIKYENTIIYKIICLLPNINNKYVGITTDMIRRKYYHKIKSLDPKNNKYKLYHFINQHGGFNNFDIIEIKKYPCENNNQAKEKSSKLFPAKNSL
jgi:predicted GIY-YIG superfamily endonuclease